jgi:hypothetical protein
MTLSPDLMLAIRAMDSYSPRHDTGFATNGPTETLG